MMKKLNGARPSAKRKIEHYTHAGKKRVNNPPVGLVTPDTDRDAGKKTYAYDPHIDPAMQWAGKTERASFNIQTVSLHVHERIDPRSIIEAIRKKNGEDPPRPTSDAEFHCDATPSSTQNRARPDRKRGPARAPSGTRRVQKSRRVADSLPSDSERAACVPRAPAGSRSETCD
jgi:hypothetical protein